MLNFVKCLFYIYLDDQRIWFLFFNLLMCISHCLICNIKEFLHSSGKFDLIMVYSPFNVLLDLVSQYFVDELFF